MKSNIAVLMLFTGLMSNSAYAENFSFDYSNKFGVGNSVFQINGNSFTSSGITSTTETGTSGNTFTIVRTNLPSLIDQDVLISFDYDYTYSYNHELTILGNTGYDFAKSDNFAIFHIEDINGFQSVGFRTQITSSDPDHPDGYIFRDTGTVNFSMHLSPSDLFDNVTNFYIQSSSATRDGEINTSFYTLRITDFTITPLSVSAVPEPSNFAMLLLGLGVVGYSIRRRKFL